MKKSFICMFLTFCLFSLNNMIVKAGQFSSYLLFGEMDTQCKKYFGILEKDMENILNIMRIMGPILVVVASTYDYITAIIKKDDDAVKKANNSFVKRIILAVVLFLLPTLLNLLFKLLGTDVTTCIR